MVLLIIIPMKNGYFIGNINPTFSDKPILFYYVLLTFLPNPIAASIIGEVVPPPSSTPGSEKALPCSAESS